MKATFFSHPTYFPANFKRSSETRAQSPLMQDGGDTVHFGMFKRKVEEATIRRDRIIINPNATSFDKRCAQEFLEATIEASKEPKKYHEKMKIAVRVGQGVATGLVTVAAAAHGVPIDPDTTHQAIEVGLLGVAGTAVGTAARLKSTDPIADALTDKKYPEEHYPNNNTISEFHVESKAVDNLAIGLFDEQGHRWELSQAQIDEIKKAREEWIKNNYSRPAYNKLRATAERVSQSLTPKGLN